MTNIFVIPTEQISKLYKIKNKLYFEEYPDKDVVSGNQNIYITSDEEIKDFWVLNTHTNEVYFLKGFYGIQSITKKIILTTDPKLIADGVQSIDDNFLQWFVKNPSCEKVETQCRYNFYEGQNLTHYKIIIPSEEPNYNMKQEILNEMERLEKEPCEHFTPIIGCIKDICSCNKDPKQAPFKHKVESLSTEEVLANRSNAYEFIDFDKKETIEEAAENFVNNSRLRSYKSLFIEGAKSEAAKEHWYNEFINSQEYKTAIRQAFNQGNSLGILGEYKDGSEYLKLIKKNKL